MPDTILITGASGALGQEVVSQLGHRSSGVRLLSLARSRRSDDEVLFDLTLPGLGNPELPDLLKEVSHVVHIAADVRWNQTLGGALNVNTLGTARLLRLLRAHAGHLQRFVYVSTSFVEPAARCPDCPPALIKAGRAFNNTYEYSKSLAEQVIRWCSLPWVIVRPSLIMGRSSDGQIARHNGIYHLFDFCARGRLPFLVGDPTGPLDLVPVDVAARAVVDALTDLATGTTVFAGSGPGAPTARDVLGLTAQYLNLFRGRRGVPAIDAPAILRCDSYRRLVRPLIEDGLSAGQKRLISLVDLFHPYMGGHAGYFQPAKGEPVYLAPPFETYARAVVEAWCKAQPRLAFSPPHKWPAVRLTG